MSARKDARDQLIYAVFLWVHEHAMTAKVGDRLPAELETVRNFALAYREHEVAHINQQAQALNIYGRVGSSK